MTTTIRHLTSTDNTPWWLCKFNTEPDASNDTCSIGVVIGDNVYPVTDPSVKTLTQLLHCSKEDLAKTTISDQAVKISSVTLYPPVDLQEIWGSGMTYRLNVDKDDKSLNVYQKSAFAERPFLFFKGTPDEVVGQGGIVNVRSDSKNTIAEPELAAFVSPEGKIVGYAVGSEVTSRDIEQQNVLYQTQAKAYCGATGLGPLVRRCDFNEIRESKIRSKIIRNGQTIFDGSASLADMVRPPEVLGTYLRKTRRLKHGGVIVTGNNVSFPPEVTIQPGDIIEHEIEGLGSLQTSVGVFDENSPTE